MKLVIFKSQKSFVQNALDFILKTLKKHSTNIALSGGSTPKPIYKNLAKKLSTKKVNFYQVDERYVPKSHQDSNQKMIQEVLGKSINFHHFDTSLPISKSLKKYQKEISRVTFDLTILGIGSDGHTASIFPNSKAISSKLPIAHTTTKNFTIKDRLTITFTPILKSKKILVLLKGKEKIHILKILQEKFQKASKISPPEIKKFPALKLLNHPDTTIYFLEK